jgi:tetratricopeptide (TPR) repeat protein
MWPGFFKFAILILLLAPSAYAIETGAGPSTKSEGQVLFNDGRDDYAAGKYTDAIPLLQRLVDRYPGVPSLSDYHEVRLWLGKSYLETGENEKAIRQFRAYLEGAIRKANRENALIWIGQAYLNLGKYDEAYLTSVEIGQDAEKDPSRKELQVEALLLRARALLGFGGSRNGETAEHVLASADQLVQTSGNSQLNAQTATLLLEQKFAKCTEFLSPKKAVSEKDATEKLDRRASCLAEGLPIYQRAIHANDTPSSARANELIKEAYGALWKICGAPPPPTRLKPTDRTPLQKKRYLQELSSRLTQDCQRQTDLALDIVRNWPTQKDSAHSFLDIQSEMKRLEAGN